MKVYLKNWKRELVCLKETRKLSRTSLPLQVFNGLYFIYKSILLPLTIFVGFLSLFFFFFFFFQKRRNWTQLCPSSEAKYDVLVLEVLFFLEIKYLCTCFRIRAQPPPLGQGWCVCCDCLMSKHARALYRFLP